jgi:hypothetical protein
MPTPDDNTDAPLMTGEEFRAIVARLGFADSHAANDAGLSAAARFFGATPRSALNWVHSGPPRPVAIALRLMLAGNWNAAQAEAMIRARRRR